MSAVYLLSKIVQTSLICIMLFISVLYLLDKDAKNITFIYRTLICVWATSVIVFILGVLVLIFVGVWG